MPQEDYVLAEYQTLRAEILQVSSQLPLVTRHAMSVMLALYAAPFLLKSASSSPGGPSTNHGIVGWVLVMVGVDFVILALAQRLAVSTAGMRKIGSYIATILEPKTNGALEYESAFYRTIPTKEPPFFGQTGAILLLITATHIVAATLVGALVVAGKGTASTILLTAIAAIPMFLFVLVRAFRNRLFEAKAQRDQFVAEFKHWRTSPQSAPRE